MRFRGYVKLSLAFGLSGCLLVVGGTSGVGILDVNGLIRTNSY